ncbi:MAG: DNA polymerase III subunit epsilon [Pseudomonadales bacterium]
MRQIVLDTETTGLDPRDGHRIIEIGCVELVNRRLTGNHYHQYINPQREVDAGAFEIHGISDAFLADKPMFAAIAEDFMRFIDGAELIIHNAPFDIGFIDHEFKLDRKRFKPIQKYCTVVDTLKLARDKHPGQKNNLDALCKRYAVDNSQRDLHGALLDAEILADVYLLMTGGQTMLHLVREDEHAQQETGADGIKRLAKDRRALPVILPSAAELEAHHAMLEIIDKNSEGNCLWLRQQAANVPDAG